MWGSCPKHSNWNCWKLWCHKHSAKSAKAAKSTKLIRQLEVVPSPAEVCQNDPVGYQTAAFVPSKVPRWRRPPYLNIPMLRDEYHITPHMPKVNVMAKLNTVPESILSEIEEYLDIWTLKVKNRGSVKIDSRRNFDILSILNSKSKSGFLTLNIDFQEIVFLLKMWFFTSNVLISKFQEFCEIVLFCMCWNFEYQEKWASMPIISKTAQLE